MSVANMNVVFNSGDKVYSKRMGRVGGFDGIIIEKRGNGYQVLDPKTGNTYQRDHYDLIALTKNERDGSRMSADVIILPVIRVERAPDDAAEELTIFARPARFAKLKSAAAALDILPDDLTNRIVDKIVDELTADELKQFARKKSDVRQAAPFCFGLIDAISKHQDELFAWLKVGGDARLLEFSPLNSWGPILKMGAVLSKQIPRHSDHQS